MTIMAPERAAYSRMVLDHILANPDLHDQSAFGREVSCGTAHCIAGWAVELYDYSAEKPWSGDWPTLREAIAKAVRLVKGFE